MKYIKLYVEQQNFYCRLFGKQPLDADNLGAADIAYLLDCLENDLSPENLCCDGELRGAALKKKATLLNGAKAELTTLSAKIKGN